MPLKLSIHRSSKPRATKLHTTDPIDGQPIHLALVSPPPSDRPVTLAVTNEVKKVTHKASTTIGASAREVEEVKELIKQSDGGSNIQTLRERRKSKETLGATAANVKAPENIIPPSEDTAEVNALLAAVAEAKVHGKGAATVHRERRRSRQMSFTDATPDVTGNTNHSPRSDTGGEAKEDEPDAAADAQETEEEDESFTKPSSALFAKPSATLSGAAARGVQQAALNQVKEAAQTTGGVYLTATEYEAIRAEVAMLHVQNKRLTEQLARERTAAMAKRSASPASPPLRRQLSINVARALEMVSPSLRRPPAARTSAREVAIW